MSMTDQHQKEVTHSIKKCKLDKYIEFDSKISQVFFIGGKKNV